MTFLLIHFLSDAPDSLSLSPNPGCDDPFQTRVDLACLFGRAQQYTVAMSIAPMFYRRYLHLNFCLHPRPTAIHLDDAKSFLSFGRRRNCHPSFILIHRIPKSFFLCMASFSTPDPINSTHQLFSRQALPTRSCKKLAKKIQSMKEENKRGKRQIKFLGHDSLQR